MKNKKIIAHISELVQLNFDFYLKEKGFLTHAKKEEETYIEHIYKKGNLYLKVVININTNDYPYYFNIILGEGDINFPESDWNSVALWRVGRLTLPNSEIGYYILNDVSQIEYFTKEGVEALKSVGNSFLNGNLDSFKEARKIQNQNREPYKILIPTKNGEFLTKYDPKSIELKERFS